MTTIPLKDDAPDWGRIIDDFVLDEKMLRAIYCAALERCAKWYDLQGVDARTAAMGK